MEGVIQHCKSSTEMPSVAGLEAEGSKQNGIPEIGFPKFKKFMYASSKGVFFFIKYECPLSTQLDLLYVGVSGEKTLL